MADTAIIIGINSYPGISDLAGPCRDATRFRDWLVDAERGGFDPDHVHLRVSTDFPAPVDIGSARPIKAELESLFHPLIRQTLNNDRPGGRLFIFAAGHGFSDYDRPTECAVYTAEADRVFYAHIALSHYAEICRRICAFDEIAVLLDACRDVDKSRQIVPPVISQFDLSPDAHRVKMFYGYATGYGRDAREMPIGGEVRGIFTEALLDALDNAPANRLGRVTGTAIKDHVHNVMKRITEGITHQIAEIHADKDKDVLFLRRAPVTEIVNDDGVETLFALQDHHLGQKLIISSSGFDRILSQTIDAVPVKLRLVPGIYKAEIEETGQSTLFEVPGNDIVPF